MKDIVNMLKEKDDFFSKDGATIVDIKDAEKELGIVFANDYRDYLEAFSIASADGHEFTGIINSDRLNVAYVTKLEKKKNSKVSNSMYVVERLDIDGIVIWQSENGKIYQTIEQSKPEEIYMSFYEYIEST